MKRINIDLFKISIIVILIGFLCCFYLSVQNGRYVQTNDYKVVLDSRTGKLHSPRIPRTN